MPQDGVLTLTEGSSATLRCDVIDVDADDDDDDDGDRKSLRWTREGSAFKNGNFSLNAVQGNFCFLIIHTFTLIERLALVKVVKSPCKSCSWVLKNSSIPKWQLLIGSAHIGLDKLQARSDQ